jgi:hypothetical protein
MVRSSRSSTSSAQVEGQSCGQAEKPMRGSVLIGVASFMLFL